MQRGESVMKGGGGRLEESSTPGACSQFLGSPHTDHSASEARIQVGSSLHQVGGCVQERLSFLFSRPLGVSENILSEKSFCVKSPRLNYRKPAL